MATGNIVTLFDAGGGISAKNEAPMVSSRIKSQQGLIRIERNVRDAFLAHGAKRIARAVDRHRAAEQADLNTPIVKRRFRQMIYACEEMIATANERLSDADLEAFSGRDAVNLRNSIAGGKGDVILLKRDGRPLPSRPE